MGIHELMQVRDIVLSLPEVSERSSHGAICFFMQNKKPICYYHDHHRGDGRVSLWCPAYPDLKKDLVRNQPERYFMPQTSSAGHFSEWLGIYLDTTGENAVNWEEVSSILEDAFRKVAPKKLIDKLKKNDP